MFKFLLFLSLYSFCLYGQVDFDSVVVGSSPTSLFEAIYQTSIGKKVLVVEQAAECGGAWKSINICGIEHADMGCHEFGNAEIVRKFLQDYAGCNIVCNTPSKKTQLTGSLGFYPSQGCYELIHNLELIMEKLGTVLLLNSTLESVFIDQSRKVAVVKINGRHLTTSKIIITNGAEIHFENPEYQSSSPVSKVKYPHLYLLISDPSPSRFTYSPFSAEGASRMMNVTCYVGLEGTGLQLVAIQLTEEKYFDSSERFLSALKKKNLIASDAKIIRTDHYTFQQALCTPSQLGIKNSPFFEYISTGHIGGIKEHFPRWKNGMTPWKEVMAQP